MNVHDCFTRRRFLAGTAATAAGISFAAAGVGRAQAAGFPARNLQILAPTAEGGIGSRVIREFGNLWVKKLPNNVRYELEFYPGASGQVGYELYLQKKEADCHNILFAAVGPEMIMYALQKPAFKYPEDFAYFMRFDKEPMSIFVRANSPFQSLEQLVDEAKKRPVIVATSRMPHAATIGMLLIADETGAKFNLVPYGGGAKTVNAVMTGEAEAIAIHTGNGTALGDQIRFLGIFDDVNPVPAQTGNAPTVNDALGLELPPMGSSRALGIHRKAIESFPDRYEILKSSAKAVMEDPAYADGIDRIGVPREFIAYGDEQACETEAKFFMELAKRYEDVLKKG